MSRKPPVWLERAKAVAQAEVDQCDPLAFRKLVERAGLEPSKDLRFADLSGVDFTGQDLSGFDFTGARLHGCGFKGAKIADARFDRAEIGIVEHMTGPWREANPHAPGRVSKVANLHEAADWDAYRKSWRRAERASAGDAHLPIGAIFLDAPFAPQMVVVPASTFLMGSPEDELGRKEDEGPRHVVTIAEPFAVGRFAVTFEEWEFFLAESGSKLEPPSDVNWGRDRRPVINVSWNDIQEDYLPWLNERLGFAGRTRYRLLSEAEWEYVARASTASPFSFGATISTDQANYDGYYTYGSGNEGTYRQKTVEVGKFPANAFGLCDMHGNVWEWVEDPWHASYAGAPLDASVWAKGGNKRRVVRGGSWVSDPRDLRSASRNRGIPDDRSGLTGFRVARSLSW